jgi:hypothetical protein
MQAQRSHAYQMASYELANETRMEQTKCDEHSNNKHAVANDTLQGSHGILLDHFTSETYAGSVCASPLGANPWLECGLACGFKTFQRKEKKSRRAAQLIPGN